MRSVNNSVETINAAAIAIVSAESRVQQATVQKRRWGGCWNLYSCFGSPKNSKRINHAALLPELPLPRNGVSIENQSLPSPIIFPFIAPPSSPASFLLSEPPTATQSPGGGLHSLASISADAYSPRGPASMFAIGPYAHETQLVSPPVFSTFTTEPNTAPNTAPLTPPPEPTQLNTPPSPEVPFAQLVASALENPHRIGETNQLLPPTPSEFQSYLLSPGSPIGNLISPSPAYSHSGISSPFPDCDLPSETGFSLELHQKQPSELSNIDGFVRSKLPSQMASDFIATDSVRTTNSLPIEDHMLESVASALNAGIRTQNEELSIDHRVSFEITSENFPSCTAKENTSCLRSTESDCRLDSMTLGSSRHQEELPHHSLGSLKEFKFDHNSTSDERDRVIGSNWWANEKIVQVESGSNYWSFFPTK